MKTEVMSFIETIPAGTSKTIYERCKDDGMITEIRVRFYPGVERALQVHPYLAMTNNRVEELMTYSGADKVITGDDDYFIFPVQLDFKNDDQIAVSVTNTDLTYDYTLCVFVLVQYAFEGAV